MSHSSQILGGIFRRGEPGYEVARRATSFNARIADRYPDVIVQANNEQEVIDAIQWAKRDGMKVGIRSGGHSWAANHIRDSGMLLDVSRLDAVTINKAAMTATTGPGRSGHQLAEMLKKQGLFFPAGHCKGVCVGGYLLQGGFGWHSRKLGLACMSVIAIDYVNGDGELKHASPEENADMYWAARGAGAGFFGVIVRFHLQVYPRPKVIGGAMATYHISKLEEVFRWAHAIGSSVPESVELMIIMSKQIPGIRGAGLLVIAPVFEESIAAAMQAAAFMKAKPRGAKLSLPFLPMPLDMMYRGVMQHYPDNHRYAVDNMWTHASIDELLPHIQRIAETLPSAPSHMLWLNWTPPAYRPAMAFSLEDDTYIALYGVWKNASDDETIAPWAIKHMIEMAYLAKGIQLADENLGQRPAKFVADANLHKLDEVRATFDAEGRFHPWMGRVS